jgi:hypothetical protein
MTTFNDIEFIAWDCEGINRGKIDEWTEKQLLVLMANSKDEFLYNNDGISIEHRFDFLRRCGIRYPWQTHIFFGGSYDFNKILEGLTKEEITAIHQNKNWTEVRVDNQDWIIRYRPKKELAIGHLRLNRPRTEENVPYRQLCDSYIRFYDVIGFFQSSFLTAMEKWLGRDYEDFELIASGKLARLDFKGTDEEFIKVYNRAELKALVKIMNILHSHLKRLGLKINRWDGAGAIAAQIFREYGLKKSYFKANGKALEKIRLSDEVQNACEYAYFGGRIESGKIGHYTGEIFNYDISSAYPYAASLLPDLNYGEWIYHKNPPLEKVENFSKLTLVRVQFYFHNDRLYYPFPFRIVGNSVLFPKSGERWLFVSEVKAALKTWQKFDRLTVMEAYEFVPNNSISPFQTLESLYRQRQIMLENKDAAEKALKLGLNSIYGKLCQKVGWNEETKESPIFHQLLFAGFITSFTRARIYEAISNELDSVISISTDGITSTKPLSLKISPEKNFGTWTLEKIQEIVQLQSGVYWYKKKDFWYERARGLGRVIGEGETEEERKANHQSKIQIRINKILNSWESGLERIHFPVKLFVTSQKALTGPDWFPRWGHWYEMHEDTIKGRGLELFCREWGKRRLGQKKVKPHLSLVETTAAENIDWRGTIGDFENSDLGEPYALPWNGAEERKVEFSDDDTVAIL